MSIITIYRDDILQVMWWDARKLTEPTEVLILDLSKNENADEPEWAKWARSHGVSCMDYDPSIPIRFMVRKIIFNTDIFCEIFLILLTIDFIFG